MKKHYFKLTLIQFLWAGNIIASQLAIENSLPFFILFLRFFLSGFIYSLFLIFDKKIYLWKKKELSSIDPKSWIWLFLTGFIGIGLYFTFMYFGISKSNATRAGLIIPTLQPLFAVILSKFILKEPITPKTFIGLFIGLIGTFLIIFSFQTKLSWQILYGNLILITSSFCYGFFSIGLKSISQNINPVKSIALFSLIASILLLPLPFLMGEKITLSYLTNPFFLLLLGYFLIATIFPFLWWSNSLKKIGIGRTVIFTFLIAPFTLIQSYFILGQKPTFIESLGGAIILIGVFVSKYLKIKKFK